MTGALAEPSPPVVITLALAAVPSGVGSSAAWGAGVVSLALSPWPTVELVDTVGVMSRAAVSRAQMPKA